MRYLGQSRSTLRPDRNYALLGFRACLAGVLAEFGLHFCEGLLKGGGFNGGM